jgi:eukaryotic-like serine/threonine-protein kinase
MSGAEGRHPADQLADALAAYDDLLILGKHEPAAELEQTVDRTLLSDWNRLTALLMLVEQTWPRTNEDRASLTEPSAAASALTASEAVEPASEANRRFGRFQILRTLGQGGFGIVFLAWDQALRRQVALKVPQPEALLTPDSRKRFLREAHAAAALDHPNIIPVYETGSVGSVAYIAAAYCPGPTLAEWLASQARSAPARDAAALVATLARAVEHAHERGVLHRDLKPSNILLTHTAADDLVRDEDQPLVAFVPRITDFSLAKLADGLGPETKSGVPFGSPPYMAPEQAEGKLKAIGPQTDVYAMGCILYEVLSGGPPFRGEGQLDTLRQVIADPPFSLRRVRKDVPVELEATVLKCLEKNPARRYPSARELAEDLDRFLAGEPTLARPRGRWIKLGQGAKRHPAALAVLATVTACLIIVLLGGRWYEARLQTAGRLSQRKDAENQAREATHRQHLKYARAMRQAGQLIQNSQARAALEILLRYRPRANEDDLRDFVWYHLLSRCHSERRTLRGHRGAVYHVEFSPRGDLLASSGQDGMVMIWDASNWQMVRKFQASHTEVNVATFAPDGQTLATVDDEGMLKLWETSTGTKRYERHAHKGDAVVALFTPDGNRIITGGRTDGFVTLWDHQGGVSLGQFRAHQGNVEGAALSPDGAFLATAGDAEVKIWSLETRSLRSTLAGHNAAQCVVFSHDGKSIATADERGYVRVWDFPNLSGRIEQRGGLDGQFSVIFTRDDRTMISAGHSGTVDFWGVNPGTHRGERPGHFDRVWKLALPPDGRTLVSASGDGTIKLWDPEPPGKRPTLPIAHPGGFGFTPDGETLMILEAVDPAVISHWDTRSGSLLKRHAFPYNGLQRWASFSPDGRKIAIANHEGTITLSDAATGSNKEVIAVALGDVKNLEFSPDGRSILLFVEGHGYSFWDIGSRRSTSLGWITDALVGMRFAPAGNIISAVDGQFVWWDPGTGRSTIRSTRPPHRLECLTISADGRTIASADSTTRRIHTWSAQTFEFKNEMAGHLSSTGSMTFSPDGKTLASTGADRTVKLWDVATGEELLTLEEYPGWFGYARFSPNGRSLATISRSGDNQSNEIVLWRTASDAPEPAASDQGLPTGSKN